MSKRTPRRYALIGNAFRNNQKRARLESMLRREADGLRSQASELDMLRTTLNGDREAGKDVEREHLFRTYERSLWARQVVRDLIGLGCAHSADPNERNMVLDILLLRQDGSSWLAPSRVTVADNEATKSVRTPDVAQAPAALTDAIAIARSAAGEELDWSREPLTDMERRMRACWIDNNLKTHVGPYSIRSLVAKTRCLGQEIAADLLAAHDEATRMVNDDKEQQRRDELRILRDQLQREGDAL